MLASADGSSPSPAQGGPSTAGGEEPYNLVVPRSCCPHCGAQIKAHHNIPVLSYLLLGGKCANCRARISPRYPIVELGTAILSAAVVWRFGWHWQSSPRSASPGPWWRSRRSTSTTRSCPT